MSLDRNTNTVLPSVIFLLFHKGKIFSICAQNFTLMLNNFTFLHKILPLCKNISCTKVKIFKKNFKGKKITLGR